MSEQTHRLPFPVVFHALMPFLRPYLRWFVSGCILILFSTAIETVLPLLMGAIVERVVSSSGHDTDYLKKICALFLVLIAVKAVIDTIQAYVIQKTGQGISHGLRTSVFKKILSLEVSYFDLNPSGRLLTRVINDIKALSELFTASISVLALDVLVICGTIVAMIWLKPTLGLLVLLPFPFVVWTVLYFGQKQGEAYREVRKHLSEINSFLGENIAGIPTIQRLSAEKSRSLSFSKTVRRHFESSNKSLRLFALVQPFANILNGAAMAILLAVGGYFVAKGEVGIGVVIAYLGYLRNLYQPIRDLVEKYNTFLSAYVSSERVVRILAEEGEAKEDVPFIQGTQTTPLSIRFNNVSFKYAKRANAAVKNVSFQVEPGRSLAIVGATGSGKSSLVRLLLRFYKPSDGKIYIGDKEISQWNRFELRRAIGMIHQEVYLNAGTLRENLNIGGDLVSDEALVRCCQNAQLWDLVASRGGLDFEIFEGGTNLSQGEKQLINFARIFNLNPRIIILDEATASIDPVLEQKVMQAISTVLSGRTTIAIAHRLSTVESCDHVLVLEEGRAVEYGKFHELKNQKGPFATFYRTYANL